jgi:hypothetical protein
VANLTDDSLLNECIEQVIVSLYPNMNKMAVFDPITGKLTQGPVILKVDAGPGRIVWSEDILLNREQLYECGLIIIMDLPTAATVFFSVSCLPWSSVSTNQNQCTFPLILRSASLQLVSQPLKV